MTRVLFHIGNAPCHGRRYYTSAADNYPDGDPRGLDINELMKGIAQKNIDYYFAEINETTLKMIEEFNNVLIANQGLEIKRFRLASANDMLEKVTMSITSSIMYSKSLIMYKGQTKPIKELKLHTSPIPWSDMSMFEEFKAELFETSFSCELTKIKHSRVSFNKKKINVWIARQPFAKGVLGFAYAGYVGSEPSLTNRMVIKDALFLANDYMIEYYYENMIEIQVIAKFLLQEFMKMTIVYSSVDMSLKFVDVNMLKFETKGASYLSEKFIDDYKIISYVNEESFALSALSAFSHWTYQVTGEYLLVTALKISNGHPNGEFSFVLTDPAITCVEDPDRFSLTNHGIIGIIKFFQTHECNWLCHKLGLVKHKFQTVTKT